MEKTESFGEKIKALRKKHDVSLADMAMLIKLKSKGSLSTLENAKNPPSYETLINLANVFAVKVDWLVGRSSQSYDEEIIFNLENQIMNIRISNDAEFKDVVPERYADVKSRAYSYSLQARASILFYLQYLVSLIKNKPELRNRTVDTNLLAHILMQGKFVKRRFRNYEERYIYLLAVIAAILYRRPDDE